MADGEKINIAKAYIEVIPSLEGSQKTIATEMGAVAEPAAKEAGEKSGKSFGESLAKGIKTTSAIIAGALTVATGAAVATGKAFINTANDISSMGDAIGDNAAKMGVSTKFYQEYDFVLQRAGSSIDSLKTSMKTLANAAVNGSDAFTALGISQEEIASLNQEQLFERTLTALQGVEDTTLRTSLASKLLGKGAIELGGVFDMTADEVAATKQEMYDLGVYMDEDMIDASDNYQDTMLNMQDSVKGLKISMIKDFLPGITSVMDGLSKVFSGRGGVEEIKTGLTSVIQNITAMAPQFFTLAGVIIQSLLDGFAPMLPQLVSSLFGFIQQGLLTLASLMPQLTPVLTEGLKGISSALLTCLPVLVEGLLVMVKELANWLTEDNNVETFVNALIDVASQIAMAVGDLINVLLPAVVKIIGAVAKCLVEPNNLKTILSSALYVVGAVAMGLIQAIPELLKAVGQIFTSIAKSNIDFMSSVLSKLKSWFSSVLTNVKSLGSSIISSLKSLPSQALQAGKDLIQGLINGVKQMASKAVNSVKDVGRSLVNGIKNVLKIGSPSKVFKQIGAWTAEGFGIGYEDEMKDVKSDMLGSMDSLTGNMTATVTANAAGGALGSNATTNYNGGNISINVYGAEGQSIDSLADAIAYKLEEMTRRNAAVWG